MIDLNREDWTQLYSIMTGELTIFTLLTGSGLSWDSGFTSGLGFVTSTVFLPDGGTSLCTINNVVFEWLTFLRLLWLMVDTGWQIKAASSQLLSRNHANRSAHPLPHIAHKAPLTVYWGLLMWSLYNNLLILTFEVLYHFIKFSQVWSFSGCYAVGRAHPLGDCHQLG